MGKSAGEKGYEIRVSRPDLNEKSHCLQPVFYLHSDNDVQRLVTNLFKSTTPRGHKVTTLLGHLSSMLLSALVYYLHYEAPEDEQNFAIGNGDAASGCHRQ
jgi:type IV secretion system protein VirD4